MEGSETSYGCAGPRAVPGLVAVPGMMGFMGSWEKTALGADGGDEAGAPWALGSVRLIRVGAARALHDAGAALGAGWLPWGGGALRDAGRVFWYCTGFIPGCSGRTQRWGQGWIQMIWGGTNVGKERGKGTERVAVGALGWPCLSWLLMALPVPWVRGSRGLWAHGGPWGSAWSRAVVGYGHGCE